MITLFHIFFLSIFLFLLGIASIILHKNLLFLFLGLEIMMNSIMLFSVFVSKFWNNCDGQMIYIFSITIAAIEASISLMLLVKIIQEKHTLNVNKLREIYE
ncbi:NADH-quinone oxidoreductase subunit NuoK [Buchnera aphidicola]|uniref:NADH-quinone oxidoreductase subunit NuoK n=1 Tax=Buchnera aphidicola TaxID=9 RepID=UPI0031B8A792